LSGGVSAPLRSETKSQAGACPDRTRAIPCTLRVSHEEELDARCVPDRPVIGVSHGHQRTAWRPPARC